MTINRRGGVYRSDTSIGEGITAIDSAIDQAEAAQLAAEQARDAALLAQAAAELAETNAELAETNAELAETNAEAAQLASEAARDLALGYANDADADRIAAEAAKLAAENARDAAQLAKTNAETAETNAETAQGLAEAARDAAQLAYDNFDDRYLGAKASNPTLDNDGNALVAGALYFNTTSSEFRGYNGTSWISLPATIATNVAFSATGNIAATNVQTAIAEVDSEKVAKSGDTMTGTLVVPAVRMETPFSFRNKIINGGFDIWQRGVSQTAFGVLSADRWIHAPLGAATFSSSRQTLLPGEFDEASYVVSIDVSNSVAAGDGFILAQKIEGVRTLAGKTVTVSIVAANSSGEDFAVELEQNFGSGGSPAVTTFVGKSTALSSTFTRHSFTVTLPSIAGKTVGANSYLTLNIWLSAGSNFNARSGSLGHNNGVFNITQVQVEEGPVATPFEQRPIGVEFSLCQRYYETGRFGFVAGSSFSGVALGFNTRKRVEPSTTVYSLLGTANQVSPVADSGSSVGTISSVADDEFGIYRIGNSGLTTGSHYMAIYESSAEL